MKPWFIQEDNVIPFPKKDTSVVRLPNVNAYPDFLTGVQDLQNHLKQGDISSDIHKKLYQDLIHRFMKVESFETPWFLKENQQDSTLDDVKKIASSLATITKDPTIIQVHKVRDTEDKGRPYHLRTVQKGHELDKEQAEQILKKLPQGKSIVLQPITNSQKKITSFNRAEGMQFVYQNKTYYIAVARTVQSQKGVKIKLFNKKELTPNNLGLQAVYNDRNSLAQDVTRVLQQKYKDDRGAMLSHVLNNAINFNAQTPIPQELKYLLDNQTIQRQVSQDFGEVLGPLLYGKGQISFPAGNEPIIDVKVGDVGIAIKSLTGSGNSLTKLKEVIDAYAATVDQQDVKKTANIKTIQKLADDNISVKDGILQIASDLQSPEMTALEAATLKIKIYDVAQLAEAIKKLVYDKEKLVPLDQVMVEIKKILSSSGKLFGMPRNIGSAVAQKIYNQQPIKYVSNILLYGLGKGIENVIINGVEKKEYGLLLKDIMNKVQAKVGFVSVNNQGIVDFMIRDFKNLNFKFDYHAYTTNPGNNRPGFAVFP